LALFVHFTLFVFVLFSFFPFVLTLQLAHADVEAALKSKEVNRISFAGQGHHAFTSSSLSSSPIGK
jgi:hypothetical protein